LDAAIGLLLELGTKRVEEYILNLNSLAIEGLKSKGYEIVSPQEEQERSGILLFRHHSIPPQEIYDRLMESNVHVAVRAGGVRISPSVYNDESEMERFLKALP